MLIRCKIQRKGGSKVLMGGIEYHFKPHDDAPDSPHIANVTNEEHIAKFLSVTEAYVFHKATAAEAPAPAPAPAQPAAAAPAIEPDPLDDDTPDLDEAKPGYVAMQAILADPEAATEEQADAAYEFLEGRKPHGRASLSTVVRKVIESAVDNDYLDANDAPELIAKAEALA